MKTAVNAKRILQNCSSWDDIQSKLYGLLKKQKGDVFEELVKCVLLLVPEYASILKNVWLHREVPQAIAKKLKLPVTDQGIDIVAETNEGDFWAVQCKYRHDTDRALTWREISTFTGLAFGVCRGISFGIICSTTERITHVLKDQNKIGFCALDVWQGLDGEFFTRLQAHLFRNLETLHPLHPRPHQKDAVKNGVEHYVTKKEARGKLIMPCGSGKSLAAYWLAQALEVQKIVIAVPSLALVRQTLKVWLRETVAKNEIVRWICVCSDESAGHIDRDDVTVLRQDIGVPCLTDPAEISAWLKREHHGLTVVFTTYQSGETLSAAAHSAKFRFDLGVLDEAHKTVGDRSKLFSHLLHDANIRIRRRLFMTATERRYAGQSDTVLSMDNPAIYGKTFYLLSFKRALEYTPPILSDYKILSIAVSRNEIAELIRKNVFVKPDMGSWNNEIEAEMLASLVALRKAMDRHPIRHAVSFHSSIKRAVLFKAHNDNFSHAYPGAGRLETFHVSGKTSTGTRARLVTEFAKSKRALITNARCLTEGVDVPGIDCVLFADPRRSAVDIVQAVGRALRPAPGKKLGYVIVPILHDVGALPEDIFESESFQEILTILRALAANDDRIIEYFKTISEGRRHARAGSVEFHFDEQLSTHINLSRFVREIDLKCWDRLAKLSWRNFEDARAFARGLALKSQSEWFAFCKGAMPQLGSLPSDVPQSPSRTYSVAGWVNWGDWLGTGSVADRLRQYRAFDEARAFARSFNLKSRAEWVMFSKGNMPDRGTLPFDIPAHPPQTYRDKGWNGWGDWLGTGTIAPRLRQFRSFKSARAFAHGLGLSSETKWRQFCKGELSAKGTLPVDIPANPGAAYAKMGWMGMGDWLGTGTIAPRLRQYRSFEEARTFVRTLGLKSRSGWTQYCKGNLPEKGKLPTDIPRAPWLCYLGEGWTGMGDWLGTGTVSFSLRKCRPFEEARAFTRALQLKNRDEWTQFCHGNLPQKGTLPTDIPVSPHVTYAKKGWAGIGDWLGTGVIASNDKRYRPFVKARAFVRTLHLSNRDEWGKFCKGIHPNHGTIPPDIPLAPAQVYAEKGWMGWRDWLGTGK